MADEDHPYIPAGEEDSRSPCPALNSLANHGYLPHDGRNLTLTQLVSALRDVYNVSQPIATGLALGGLVLCGRRKPGLTLARELDLHDLARHNFIEHDASLVHADAPSPTDKYAPTAVEPALLRQLLDVNTHTPGAPAADGDSDDDEQKDDAGPSPSSSATSSPVSETFAGAGVGGAASLTLHDLCRFQLQRQAPHASRPLDALHARFVLGEVALMYEVLSVPAAGPHAAPLAPPPARAWRSSSEARRTSSVEEFASEVDVAFKLQLDAQAEAGHLDGPVAQTPPEPESEKSKNKSMRRRLRDSVGSSFSEKGQKAKKVAIDGDRRGRAHARGYSESRDTTGHSEADLSAEEGEEGDGARVVPKRFLAQWLGEERLPEGWARPAQELGFPTLHERVDEIRKVQAAILAAGLDDVGPLAMD